MDLFDDQPTPVLMLAGVDEVGRGPLAGPVIAAAVILDPSRPITGLRDSKKLTAARRAELAEIIESQALAVGIGRAEVAEIDLLNILRASLLAMERAVANLALQPDVVYVDGNITPTLAMPAVAIVGGDDRVASISAASIVAKVIRDREMDRAAAHLSELRIRAAQRLCDGRAPRSARAVRAEPAASHELRADPRVDVRGERRGDVRKRDLTRWAAASSISKSIPSIRSPTVS